MPFDFVTAIMIILTYIALLSSAAASFSSFSSSFSSSYTNINGKEHTESVSQEKYSERDTNGLNRRGSGKLVTENGNQVFEASENCDNERCISAVDKGKRRLR